MNRLRNLDFKTDVLPFIIATGGEFVALFFWLRFLDQGQFVLANVFLWAGFIVERLAVYLWIQYIYREKEGAAAPQSLPLIIGGLFLITLSEVLIWIFWLALADGDLAWLSLGGTANFVLAALLLMVLMLVEHSVEMAALRGTKPLAYVGNPNTIFFTFMEVIGAVGWLYFVRHGQPGLGAACLLLGLSVEHVLQGSALRPEEKTPVAG